MPKLPVPDGASTRLERMRLLIEAIARAQGLETRRIHSILLAYFGLGPRTRQSYIDDLSETGFIHFEGNKWKTTPKALRRFNIYEAINDNEDSSGNSDSS